MRDTEKDRFQSLLNAWADAIVANDAERIGAFAEPDWILVGPEGGPGQRERFLALVASGDLTHSAMTFDVLDVRVYGEVAVVLSHSTNQGSWQGTPFAPTSGSPTSSYVGAAAGDVRSRR
jgi:ketosteroid isomerase-like protein